MLVSSCLQWHAQKKNRYDWMRLEQAVFPAAGWLIWLALARMRGAAERKLRARSQQPFNAQMSIKMLTPTMSGTILLKEAGININLCQSLRWHGREKNKVFCVEALTWPINCQIISCFVLQYAIGLNLAHSAMTFEQNQPGCKVFLSVG